MENERFTRLEGETDKAYQTRLSQLKLINKEDLDWEDIKELLQSDKHRDTLRREGYGIEIATEYYEELIQGYKEEMENMQIEYKAKLKHFKEQLDKELEDKRLKEMENKVLQLEKEKIKLKDQRNDLNAIKRDIARTEHIVECVKEEIINLNKSCPLVSQNFINDEETERDSIILLSDMHIGASCDNILDQYNPQIAKEKLEYYIDECVNRIVKDKINKTYFLVAGDLISGVIHTTTRLANRINVSEQVIFASEIIAEAINKISQHSRVIVGILTGNHDRVIINKEQHIEDENFVSFIREMVRLRLKDNENVTVVEPQDSTLLNLDIRGYKIAVVHGNLDRRRNISRLVEMYHDVYDYILMGHFHKFQIEQHNHTTCITNGAFAGEEYGKNYRLYNKPQQLYMTITDDGIETITPINLNNYKK